MEPKNTVVGVGHMLRDESVVVESSWACGAGEEPWRDLDRQLRSVAKRRGALDHEELTLIREAVAMQLWRPLGMTSMREYLERRLGYGPQVAAERLRVAEALDALPAIEQALADDELSYSAVRELTRVATRKTDAAWVKACRGKVVSEIQEMVAEREPGDPPEAKPKALVRRRRFCADLLPDVDALVRQARQVLEAEHGEKLDNDELIRALAARVLEPAAAGDKPQRPRHQIAVTVCRACKQGWQRGAGREIPISAIDVEVALCDAQHAGSLDGAPGKLTQNIPAATRRFVWQRDHGRCRIPGCRAACFIDVHHLVPRELGGTHDVSNLALLCAGHHRALHAGLIVIEGTAPDVKVVWLTDVPHVGDLTADDESVGAGRSTEASVADESGVDRSADAARADANGPEDRSPVPRVGDDRTWRQPESATYAGEQTKPTVPDVGASHSARHSSSATPKAKTTSRVPHVGDPTRACSDLDEQQIADVQAGLVRLGFRRDEARAAVMRAHEQLGSGRTSRRC
jgi:hypothetical protein